MPCMDARTYRLTVRVCTGSRTDVCVYHVWVVCTQLCTDVRDIRADVCTIFYYHNDSLDKKHFGNSVLK